MSLVNPDADIKNNNNMLNNGAVDKDIKSDSNLLNNANTVQDVNEKVLTTEVTSVAQEELKSGTEIKIPDADELYARATTSFIRNIKFLNDLITGRTGKDFKISRKGMNRVMNAILQLPMDGLPVTLQGKEEKAAFALGQRLIADRYLITHYHIQQERKRLQDEKNNAMNNKTEQVAQDNEGAKNE